MSGEKATTVFITNGHSFIGPYLPGDMALIRGRNDLEQDKLGAIYVVQAATLEEAKEAWRKADSDRKQNKS